MYVNILEANPAISLLYYNEHMYSTIVLQAFKK